MVTQGLEGKVGLYQGSETFLVCNGDLHVDGLDQAAVSMDDDVYGCHCDLSC